MIHGYRMSTAEKILRLELPKFIPEIRDVELSALWDMTEQLAWLVLEAASEEQSDTHRNTKIEGLRQRITQMCRQYDIPCNFESDPQQPAVTLTMPDGSHIFLGMPYNKGEQ